MQNPQYKALQNLVKKRFHLKTYDVFIGNTSTIVAPIYKNWHCHTPCHMRSKNIFEAYPYSNAFMRYEGFYELLQTTIIAPISDT